MAAGDLTLTGDSSFTGNIAVNGGKLSATGGPVANNSISGFGASLNTRTITVESGAVLEFATGNVFGGHNTVNVPDIIVNGGTITNKELVITDPLLIKVNNALRNVTLNNGTITATEGNQNSNIDTILRPGEGYGAWGLNGTVTSTGTLVLTAANIYTTNTTVNAGTLELADNAQLKFVTGTAPESTNRISGAGTVTFDGDFNIDTALTDASVLTSGAWTLVDKSTLTATFNLSFTVLGAGWSETADVWTKTVGSKKYTFTEADGKLVTDPAGVPVGNYLLFTYRRSDLSVAAGVTADCETDADLVAPWTAATGAPGVVIQVDDNFTFTPPAAADTDRVRVYVPRGANTRLFGRLNVVVP